ncbi:hypothetical protein JYB62_09095 [Algoriphagus lutimaris]|uniref:DUF6515 family protein n=1 Tax=Algoriphagus lutimaris TaxID=613197 RepID=UPI00196A82B7|nr:DUF6515 family protein [Algoriphagus lutimaris]MBN3520158.1 hypothetical protein [Algoriphagus lutimaris]
MEKLRIKLWVLGVGLIGMVFISDLAQAQRVRAGAGRAGARPATTRQAPSREMSRPPSRPSTRPATRPSTSPSSRPNMSSRDNIHPKNSSSRPTLNGGANKVTRDRANNSKVSNIRNNPSDNRGGGNRNTINNNITINRNNVNVRNNHVRNYRPYRPPYRPYPRPPYIWGGYGFSWFRPYYYHPYRPYYWGPVWHPWGFFVAALATTAIIVSIENQDYNYNEGVFYVETDDGYVVVEAPQGATVKVIPKESKEVEVSPTVNNYYYGGTFYEKSDGGYTVVPPPAGAVVDALPEGGEEVKVGDQTYVKIGDTYYMPVQEDGKDMYEIVQVEEVEE